MPEERVADPHEGSSSPRQSTQSLPPFFTPPFHLSHCFLQRQFKHQQPIRCDLCSGLHIRPTSPFSTLILDNGLLMARRQNQKRSRADEPSRAAFEPPTKKSKTRNGIGRKAWESWEYPPEFYDTLSKISLTRRALKELNRRNRASRSHPSLPLPSASALSCTRPSRDLGRFARHGGPDLRDLRGVS